MKRHACLVVFFILCLSISGCSKSEFFDIQNSISAPKLVNDEQNIKDVINKYTDGKFILKFPRKGDFRSAIIIENLSPNGKEAVAFYQVDRELAEIHIVILHNKNEIWNIVGDIVSYKTNINYVNLIDLNGDGFKEIIVNWENIDSSKDDTSIYKYDNTKIIEVPTPDGDLNNRGG